MSREEKAGAAGADPGERETVRVRCSHFLDEHQPRWPGAPGLIVTSFASGEPGDADGSVIEMHAHYGTHVDLPRHVVADGRSMSDLALDDFVFTSPVVLDCPLGDGEHLTSEMVEAIAPAASDADFVFLRSGFERYRSDRDRYETRGPGIDVEAASALRRICPRLRGVALDWLSICSFRGRSFADEVHAALLAEDAAGRFVLVFEDVRVAALGSMDPRRVHALPLFIRGLDGSPCTIEVEC